MRNIKKYSQIYSGKLPEFEDGDIFRTTIFLNKGEENLKIGEVTGEEKLLEKEKKVYVLSQSLRKDIIKQGFDDLRSEDTTVKKVVNASLSGRGDCEYRKLVSPRSGSIGRRHKQRGGNTHQATKKETKEIAVR